MVTAAGTLLRDGKVNAIVMSDLRSINSLLKKVSPRCQGAPAGAWLTARLLALNPVHSETNSLSNETGGDRRQSPA